MCQWFFFSPYLEHWDLEEGLLGFINVSIHSTNICCSLCLASAMAELAPRVFSDRVHASEKKRKVFKDLSQRAHPFLHL